MQVEDFLLRPRPVLQAEGKDGDDLNAEFAGGAHRAAQRFDAEPMAFAARQAALRRPAAVAIHDDGDVMGGDVTVLLPAISGPPSCTDPRSRPREQLAETSPCPTRFYHVCYMGLWHSHPRTAANRRKSTPS